MAEPTESWGQVAEVRRQVKVGGAPDLMVPPPRGLHAARPRRYRLHQVDVLARWTPGAAGTLKHFVTLRVHEVIGPHVLTHRDGKLHMDQLREVPDWLASILERATIRCQCQYLGTAPGGEEPAEVVTDGCPLHLTALLTPPPPDTGPEPF